MKPKYRVTQYAHGEYVHSKVYRSKLWARWIAFLVRGPSVTRLLSYSSEITEEHE